MSNTQYQRVVQDLKKAGLNPVLALHNNIGSVPSGSVAQTGSGGISKGSNAQTSESNIGNALLQLIAGIVSKGKTSTTNITKTVKIFKK